MICKKCGKTLNFDEAELKLLTRQEFRWLMEGLSITQTKAFSKGKPGTIF